MQGSVGLALGSVGTAAGQGGAAAENPLDDVLSKIYANGLVDPQQYEVFHMPHADLRFLGQNPGYPGFVYLEDHPGEADSRFGAEYYSRYYPTPQGVGGFAVRQVAGFDPLWNHSFTGLGGLQIVDVYGFRQVPDPTGPGVEINIAQQRWAEVHGFFDGPIAYPTPGFNSGASEHLWIDLYNDFSGGFFNHPALDLNGYGQPTFNIISKAQGVITAALNLSWWNGPSPFAGDGPGIFFTNGTADPPLGIIANTLINAGATNGPTKLGFWTSSAPGTLGTPIATMDWTNGAQFNAKAIAPSVALRDSTAFLEFQGGAAPPVAPAASLRMYWDDAQEVLQCSADGFGYGIAGNTGIIPVMTALANGATATTFTGVGPNLPFVHTTIQRWLSFGDGMGGVFTIPSWS